MKCKIPEISWHNRDPVLSVDIQPKANAVNNYYRLASGGTDAHVLIWYMKLTSSGEYGDIVLDLAADLARHQRAVNVVKWSPSGELLASGDDESVVFIWKQKSDSEPLNILDSTNEQDKEVWITLKVLRGHMEDIYDLSWAPNSMFLVSGSVDNSAIIWDVQKGKSLSILNDHKGFVQGVAWDPKNQYIATLSTDRYMRIFDIQTKKVLYRVSKGTLPVQADNNLHGKRMRLFHDDTLQTFFRRLSFTPDGKLLLTPAGVTDYDGCTRPLNTTYAFSRYGFRQPAIVLPCPDQYTVAVRCCPLLFKLRPYNAEKNLPVVPLPYRMIFAIATKSSVYFYDTQQKQPFALISNIHYTRLTDITWSNDGRIVVVSSTDGFCSLITFEQGELGEEYENSEAALEAALAQVTKKTKKQKDSDGISKSRKPSTDDTAAVQKENASLQKETQLETVLEQAEKEIGVKTDKTKEGKGEQSISEKVSLENKNTQEKNKDISAEDKSVEEPGEIKIKKTDNCSKPIAIKRKRGPVTDQKNNTTDEKPVPMAMPIAIKRKPGPILNNDRIDDSKKSEEGTSPPQMTAILPTKALTEEKPLPKATLIAIKRKPGPVAKNNDKNDNSAKSVEVTSPKKTAIIPSKVLAADIIIDKEILSSDEKFESPEKKSRAVTPITVRRHPRTPSSLSQTPTSMKNILKTPDDCSLQSPLSSLPKESSTSQQDKKAKPIAVRRTPRAIIKTPSVVNTPSLVEEAMDAWPLHKELNKENPKEPLTKTVKKSMEEPGISPLPVSETTCERTEDIRLIYEETNEEPPAKEFVTEPMNVREIAEDSLKHPTPSGNETPRSVALDKIEATAPDAVEKTSVDPAKPLTPSGNKTPRRVALKTISTPKSKKKLLD